jgi:galactitol-specific phosphotransferase system IIB component
MGKKYLIYVACGNAAASANLVKYRLSDLLKQEKVNVEIAVMRVAEIANSVAGKMPDLVVIAAGNFVKEGLPEDLPVLSGLPLMTMVGVNDFVKKVKESLNIKE